MELLKALFEQANEGIIVTNHEGIIVRSNPAAERMFGYPTGELVGQSIEILLPENMRQVHRHHRQSFHEHPHPRAMGLGLNLQGQRRDGSIFPVEVSLSPYESGEGKFVIAFIIDITVREHLARQREHMAVELEKEKELGALKSRFVNIASHEFRTPLATILSSASLIQTYAERSNFDGVKKHALRIKNSVNHLQNILQEFLSLGRIEDGKVEPKIEEIDLLDLFHEIEQDLTPMLKAGQRLLCEHSGNAIVPSDRNLLRIIVLNLLTNAIKYSPENSTVQVFCPVAHDHFEIVVRDRGIGIAEHEQAHLFERFFRASNAGSTAGTGLGLYIVKRYAELLGGRATFSSRLGEGSEFRVWFPIVSIN